jgi:hypothetical protein
MDIFIPYRFENSFSAEVLLPENVFILTINTHKYYHEMSYNRASILTFRTRIGLIEDKLSNLCLLALLLS